MRASCHGRYLGCRPSPRWSLQVDLVLSFALRVLNASALDFPPPRLSSFSTILVAVRSSHFNPLLVRRRWISGSSYPSVSLPDYLGIPQHANLAHRSQVTPLSLFPGSDGSDMKAAHFPSLRAANSPKDGICPRLPLNYYPRHLVYFDAVFPSKIKIGSGTNISSSIEVIFSYQWKPKRMNVDNHLEDRLLSAPSAPATNPISADPQKHLIAALALKVSLVSAGHEFGTACVSARSKSEGLREPSFETSLQVKLPSIQPVGNLESNGPRNSYAAILRCGIESSLHSPLFVSPRPLSDIEELEVSGESRVIISSPPGDAHGEVAVKAPSCSGDVSFVCLNDATTAEEVVFEELEVTDAFRMDAIRSKDAAIILEPPSQDYAEAATDLVVTKDPASSDRPPDAQSSVKSIYVMGYFGLASVLGYLFTWLNQVNEPISEVAARNGVAGSGSLTDADEQHFLLLMAFLLANTVAIGKLHKTWKCRNGLWSGDTYQKKDFGLVCWHVALQFLLSQAPGLGILIHSLTWTIRSLRNLDAGYRQLGTLPFRLQLEWCLADVASMPQFGTNCRYGMLIIFHPVFFPPLTCYRFGAGLDDVADLALLGKPVSFTSRFEMSGLCRALLMLEAVYVASVTIRRLT
ncbi:hypothetical protein Nepgr_006658 [Nepenthes gracilis]|uniref:Uncharacterized protein n=1 Tax=Nepenthes gracilis TaxID=150966 RepID=A0AAD3S5F2_NEPGR|nr:hypothetical protein Nepgr_006658 [Nepenthes gracilis]